MALQSIRPQFEVADIFRDYGEKYKKTHPMSKQQRKVMHAITVCRTSFLGGHIEKCDECGHERISYNSCRNRHCPKCQGIRMRKWVDKRKSELLPIPYFHLIFTIPHTFNVLIAYNEKVIYKILFKAASHALATLAGKYLGGTLGTIATLHTWGQNLSLHSHLHCIVTGGALSFDKKRWVPAGEEYLFDVNELSDEFRKKFCALMKNARKKGDLTFKHKAAYLSNKNRYAQFLDEQDNIQWVVYCKKPFAGPEKVIEYIGRYTHRVAISNSRIKSIKDGKVTFDYKDYRDVDEKGIPKHKLMVCTAEHFIRLFMLHILPKNFVKIRFYGILAGACKNKNIQRCRQLIGLPKELPSLINENKELENDSSLCPICGKGIMRHERIIIPERPPDILNYFKLREYKKAA